MISCIAFAGNYKELSVVDPVSKTEFHFKEAEIVDSSAQKFLKYTIELPNSYIDIYSMKNNNSESFSWDRLNEFDAGNKYGTLKKKEKLTNIDGWIRYYEAQNKGIKYINCISIIRGKKYAVFLSERAFNIEQLSTPELIKNTKFKKAGRASVRSRRVPASFEVVFWILMILSLVIFSILHVNLKISPKIIFIFGGILLVAACVCSYVLFAYPIAGIIGLFIIYGISLIFVGMSDSWEEIIKYLGEILNKIGN